MRHVGWIALVGLFVLIACRKEGVSVLPEAVSGEEDLEAQAAFQGIWVDDENDCVLFRVRGDSIYYPDTVNCPERFCIRRDSLVMSGESTVSYFIEQRGTDIFRFRVSTGDLICLKRSDNPEDTLLFEGRYTAPIVLNEVMKKDTVVFGNGNRYHCYVFVNPSKYKVVKKSFTDESIEVENVYYDNVVHLSVYCGKECVYSKDFVKGDFAAYVPLSFLEQSILSKADFYRISTDGCHFVATIGIPDDASCYAVDICVNFAGEMSMRLQE
ncbi:MAG: DUF4738 domain-containing protein [Clostridium sp.]|nr:DUF4738 domain-containing protein [Clostridium sp.]